MDFIRREVITRRTSLCTHTSRRTRGKELGNWFKIIIEKNNEEIGGQS